MRGPGRDLEEDLRTPPAGGVRRPRPGRVRRTRGRSAAAGQRGERHRGRSHRSGRTRPEAAAEEVPPWTADAHPHRLGRGHPRVRQLAVRTRLVAYSVGMTITDAIHQTVLKVPAPAWTMAVEPGGQIRDGAGVAELDGDCLKDRPEGMRLIVRRERPHPGAQLRFTDADGMRLTCFATNTRTSRSSRWNCVTAGAPVPKTASAPPAPPACVISRFMTWRRTGSGWSSSRSSRSSRSPWTCSPGCRCSP